MAITDSETASAGSQEEPGSASLQGDPSDRLDDVFEDAPSAMLIHDAKGVTLRANREARRLFRCTGDELIGRRARDLHVESEIEDEAVAEIYKRLGEGDSVENLEVRYGRDDGSEFPGLLTVRPLIGDDGTLIGTHATVADITEQKLYDAERERLMMLLKQTQTLANVGGWELDLKNESLYWTPEVFKIHEAPPEFAPDLKSAINFYAPEYVDTIRNAVDKAIQKGISFDLELQIITATGKRRWVHAKGAPTRVDGDITKVTGTFRDIHAQKESEEKTQLFLTALEHAVEYVIVTDTQGVIQYVNKAFERTLGYRVDEVIGRRIGSFKSGVHDKAYYDDLWNQIRNNQVWTGRFVNRHKDGHLVEVEATISPILDPGGLITGYVSTQRDVTQEVELQLQLRQSQKMESIGTLAGGIAHDFNNLLDAIRGNAELALDAVPEDQELAEHLREIIQAGSVATDLVDQILTVSRKHMPERKVTDPKKVIESAINLIRRSFPSWVALDIEVLEDCGAVMIDPTQMHQLVMNLCTNALHALDDSPGTVTIRLFSLEIGEEDIVPEGRYVCLSVSDDGEGMDPSFLERVFDPYFTTKAEGRGTGLGLAMVHSIVSAQGGKVDVSSEPGRGSTFTVYLPETDSEIVDQKIDASDSPVPESLSVLLIDDEPGVLRVNGLRLRKIGHNVKEISDPVNALGYLEMHAESVDLVITDYTMPTMSGVEFGRRCKEEHPDLPVMMLSGLATDDVVKEAHSVGIPEVITKPVTVDALNGAIRRMTTTG